MCLQAHEIGESQQTAASNSSWRKYLKDFVQFAHRPAELSPQPHKRQDLGERRIVERTNNGLRNITSAGACQRDGLSGVDELGLQ